MMAKITELPSDDDSTPSISNKSYSSPNHKTERKLPVKTQPKNSGGSYVRYLLFPILVALASVFFKTIYHDYTSNVHSSSPAKNSKAILMTQSELSKHDGSDTSVPIYIAILGRVYDVDKGKKHYGKGSGYNVFAGRDSTPSFVTGQFSRDKATDDVTGLGPEDMLGIKGWMDFYRKDYTYVGKVIGRYYDEHGKPTAALKKAKELIKEGQLSKEKQANEDKKFPPCNSKWSQSEGSEVWCSPDSGGIHRSWAGVPRQLFKPGRKEPKCVCVRTSGPSSDTMEGNDGDLKNPNLKLYPKCQAMDVSCKL